ncbi:hypothetical protein GCM10010129_81970 [Streptomyces fumigatiscleroticus]|nr:hypothetical protein GCM10010129_81970 [Streptomyces fumigatiscleroticus]
MDTPRGSRLERALSDFAEQYRSMTRTLEQMRALSVTARSRDDAVEVTVHADGRAVGVRFVGGGFREMTAQRLGDSVMEALSTARAEVTARVTALLTTADVHLSAAAEHMTWHQALASEPVPEAPPVCWRRLVRAARAMVVGPVPVHVPGAVKAQGAVGARRSGTRDGGPRRQDQPGSGPPGPLWGRSRSGMRSPGSHAVSPTELREAVMALSPVLRGTCRPEAGGCICSRIHAGTDTEAEPA